MKELRCEFCDSADVVIVNDYLYLCHECGEYGDVEEATASFEKIQRRPKHTRDEEEDAF